MYSNPTFDSDSLFGSPIGSSVNDADLFAGRYTMVRMDESLDLRDSADKSPLTPSKANCLINVESRRGSAGVKLDDSCLPSGGSPLRMSTSRLPGSENIEPCIPLEVSLHPGLVNVVDSKHIMSPEVARQEQLPTASSLPQQDSIPIAAIRDDIICEDGKSRAAGSSVPSPAETRGSAAASAMQSPLMDRFLDAAEPELNLNPDTYLSECSRDDCLTPTRHAVHSPGTRGAPSALPGSTPASPGVYLSGASLSLAQSVSFAREAYGIPDSPSATYCTGEPCSPPDLAPPAPSASPGDTRSSPSQLLGPTIAFGGLPAVLRPNYLPPPAAQQGRRPTAPSSFASSPGMTCAPSEWTIDATNTLAVITDSASDRLDSRPTSGSSPSMLQPPAWATPGAPCSPEPRPLRQKYADAATAATPHGFGSVSTPLSPGLQLDRALDSLDLGQQDSYFTLGGSSGVFSLGLGTARAAATALEADEAAGGPSLRSRFGGGANVTPLEIPAGATGSASDDDGSHVRCAGPYASVCPCVQW